MKTKFIEWQGGLYLRNSRYVGNGNKVEQRIQYFCWRDTAVNKYKIVVSGRGFVSATRNMVTKVENDFLFSWEVE